MGIDFAGLLPGHSEQECLRLKYSADLSRILSRLKRHVFRLERTRTTALIERWLTQNSQQH